MTKKMLEIVLEITTIQQTKQKMLDSTRLKGWWAWKRIKRTKKINLKRNELK